MQKIIVPTKAETRPISISPIETFVWFLMGIMVIAGKLVISSGPELFYDSYQYLSVASNILSGNGIQTSIVHFDIERSWQRVPAPMTTFPSGYPFFIAALGSLGIKLENAALLISAINLPCLILLYHFLAKQLTLSRASTRFIFLWTIGNSWAVLYSTSILADSLFTLITFGSIACFLVATVPKTRPGHQIYLLICANILLGLSYWIRYAGIFLFATAFLFFVSQLWIQRDRKSLTALASLTISASIIAIGIIRNALLVGTWKGGDHKQVFHPIFGRIYDSIISIRHLFLGGFNVSQLGTMELVSLLVLLVGILSIFGILGAVLWAAYKRDISFLTEKLRWPACFLIMYVAIYCCAIIYLTVTSVFETGLRYFYPLLPSILLLGAIFITAIEKNALLKQAHKATLIYALLAMSTGYIIINSHRYTQQSLPAPHEIVQRFLAGKTADNVTLREWIERNIPSEATVVADDGQATAYVLQRKTVSLVPLNFSNQVWTEESIMAVITTYGAEYLIIYAPVHGRSSLDLPQTPFLESLAYGHPPGWLTVAARNDETIIYRAHIVENQPKKAIALPGVTSGI